MQSQDNVTLWQALTPPTVARLEESGGWALQPSAVGDTFALLKLSRDQALWAAEAVWQRFFPNVTVVEIALPGNAVDGLPVETVAYEAQSEYRLNLQQLATLSEALLQPVTVTAELARPGAPVDRRGKVCGTAASRRPGWSPATPGGNYSALAVWRPSGSPFDPTRGVAPALASEAV